MPIRIQRKRTKGWRMPPGARYVGRPTQWRNCHRVGGWCPVCDWQAEHTPAEAVDEFRRDLERYKRRKPEWFENWIAPLRDQDLACWCPLPEPGEPDWCHAAVLLEMANE